MRWCYFYSHFTDEKTQHRDKAHECLSNLPKSHNDVAGVCVWGVGIPGRLESLHSKYCTNLNSLEVFILCSIMKKTRIRWLHWAQCLLVRLLFASTFERDGDVFQNILTAAPQTVHVPKKCTIRPHASNMLYVILVKSCQSSAVRWCSCWPVYLGEEGDHSENHGDTGKGAGLWRSINRST